jgi:D-arabinose 1-dehydrogenase-like Zn-dependent alcohol dehydrogenase
LRKKGGPFELVERELPHPGRGEVRVKVQVCGVCHSDSIAKEGRIPSGPFPIVPGHEIAGTIDVVGEGVIGWSIGTRVGVGWLVATAADANPAAAAISSIAAICGSRASIMMAAMRRPWSLRRMRWR